MSVLGLWAAKVSANESQLIGLKAVFSPRLFRMDFQKQASKILSSGLKSCFSAPRKENACNPGDRYPG
jgi:hypothetical protein